MLFTNVITTYRTGVRISESGKEPSSKRDCLAHKNLNIAHDQLNPISAGIEQ